MLVKMENDVFAHSGRADIFWGGPSSGSFWRVVGPPRALVGLCLGSFSMSLGALVAFGVRVLRDVVDFSYHGGQVEASRRVSEAFGGHSGAQKPSKTH